MANEQERLKQVKKEGMAERAGVFDFASVRE